MESVSKKDLIIFLHCRFTSFSTSISLFDEILAVADIVI